MSEYWKSTPKYWCKFCEVYVRDTKLDKQQHESTGRHQGNIQKNLRELHKKHAQDEREKAATQHEADRIRAKVTGQPLQTSKSSSTPASAPAKATVEDRKRQMEQLAAMGIAVPEEFRKELAIAGDWQTQSYTRLDNTDDEDKGAASVGIRKRKAEEEAEDEEEEPAGAGQNRNAPWGSRTKVMKTQDEEHFDFDRLLSAASVKKEEAAFSIKQEDKRDDTPSATNSGSGVPDATLAATIKPDGTEETPRIKTEDTEAATQLPLVSDSPALETADEQAPVVFKKRKGRPK